MIYTVIDNFIEEDECEALIEFYENNIPNINNKLIIHGGRNLISNTSKGWDFLENNSSDWSNLSIKLNSNAFLNLVSSKLKDNKNRFILSNFFKDNKNGFFSFISSRLHRVIISSSIKLLISAIIFRCYMNLKRVIFYYFNRLFRRKETVELLIDFSISSKGYKREIHRDSDLRKYVFILFLNAIEDSGGNFEIYELNHKNKNNIFKPQPNVSACKLIESFSPKPGFMILFKNTADAYHAVSEMTSDEKRYFIYGGYTQLAGSIREIRTKTTKKLPTEFHLYI